MADFRDEYERIRNNAERIRKTRSVYGEMVDFYENVLYLMLKSEANVNVKIPEISREMVKTKFTEGFPLLNRDDFPVDSEAAGKVLRKIQEFIPGENKELQKTASNLLIFLKHSGNKFWQHLLKGEEETLEEVAQKIHSPLHQVIFLGMVAIKPSLRFVRSRLVPLLPDESTWRKNYCPVCGSLPSVLLLKEKEGRKFGCCSWCEHQWLMNRIECPYCQNQLQQSLGYIAIEDDEVYRVEYCEDCKYYFKVIDCRPLEIEPVVALEELTTLHLDMLAQEKGYKMPPTLSPVVYGGISEN